MACPGVQVQASQPFMTYWHMYPITDCVFSAAGKDIYVFFFNKTLLIQLLLQM